MNPGTSITVAIQKPTGCRGSPKKHAANLCDNPENPKHKRIRIPLNKILMSHRLRTNGSMNLILVLSNRTKQFIDVPNENAQRCAAEGSRLDPRRDRRIRWSKS